jgi:uncharacterized protein with HEPN domain
MQRDEATLLDIAEAARLVVSFVQDMSKAVFLDDYKTQSALLYQLIVIGITLMQGLRPNGSNVPE